MKELMKHACLKPIARNSTLGSFALNVFYRILHSNVHSPFCKVTPQLKVRMRTEGINDSGFDITTRVYQRTN
jgi:hypothetical protein